VPLFVPGWKHRTLLAAHSNLNGSRPILKWDTRFKHSPVTTTPPSSDVDPPGVWGLLDVDGNTKV
jgi:hypothetical protein